MMNLKKFLFFSPVFVSASLLVFLSCSKNSLIETNQKIPELGKVLKAGGGSHVPNLSSCYAFASMSSGMINFDDPQDFKNCLECLDSMTYMMDSILFDQLEVLGDSVLADSLESLNYTPYDVYLKFNDHYEFESKIYDIINAENEWMDEGDTTVFPGYTFNDFAGLSVINNDGEFAIEDSFFVFDDGEIYQISSTSTELLDSFQQNLVTESHPKIEKKFSLWEECRIFAHDFKQKQDGDLIAVGSTGWINFPFVSRYISRTMSYKVIVTFAPFFVTIKRWPNRGLEARVYGACHHVTNDECDEDETTVDGRHRSSGLPLLQISSRDWFFNQGPHRAKSGRVYGIHGHKSIPDYLTNPTW